MAWSATAQAWFSTFFEKALVSRVNRRISIRIVRFCQPSGSRARAHGFGLSHAPSLLYKGCANSAGSRAQWRDRMSLGRRDAPERVSEIAASRLDPSNPLESRRFSHTAGVGPGQVGTPSYIFYARWNRSLFRALWTSTEVRNHHHERISGIGMPRLAL